MGAWKTRVAPFIALLIVTAPAGAEIAPEYYRQSQDRAPEALLVEVLDVDRSICWFWMCDGRDITATLKVKSVERSATGLAAGDTVVVKYWHDERDGISGPRPIRILGVGEQTPAYLSKEEGGHYGPAARGASFQPLIGLGGDE